MTTVFSWPQNIEIKKIPAIKNPSIASWETEMIELKNNPAMNERQKNKNALDLVILQNPVAITVTFISPF